MSAGLTRSNSTSSTHSSERSPLLSTQALPSDPTTQEPIPQRPLSSSYLSASGSRIHSTPPSRVRKASSTKRQSFETRTSVPTVNDDAKRQARTSVHDDLPDTQPLLADRDSLDLSNTTDNRQDELVDQEAFRANVLPFPSQIDPTKPLRPKHYLVKRNVGKVKGFVKRNEGLLLLAFAQLFFSTMNFFFKLINLLPPEESEKVTALEIIFIRMSITWIGCVAFMLISGVQDPFLGPKEVRGLLALRGFVGFFGLFGLYYSLQYLSLADATVITFLGPLATGLLGYMVLGEPFTLREALGGIVSLSGVVLIARPAFMFGRQASDSDLDIPIGEEMIGSAAQMGNGSFAPPSVELLVRGLGYLVSHSDPPALAALNYTNPQPHDGGAEPDGVTEAQRLLAVGLALLGICGGAGAYITIRAIGRRASATHSVAYFSLYSTIVSAILMWLTGTKFVLPYDSKWIILLVCVGIFGLAAQILLAMGLQREKAGRAVSVTYIQIVFASVYQLVFLHLPIQPLSALGMVVILFAAGWVAAGKA